MGQSLKKFGMKEKEIDVIIEKCYNTHFADPNKDFNSAEFFFAVSQAVAEINKMLGHTQFRVPDATTLEQEYNTISSGPLKMLQRVMTRIMAGEEFDMQNHHNGKGKSLTKKEFQKILEVVILNTGVSGMGAKDMFLYLFGIPFTALFLKQQFIPGAIRNDVFIPGVTSATVFLLAKLNKI